MIQKKAYITFANAKKLSRLLLNYSGEMSRKKLYESIFDTDLSEILSFKDARSILAFKNVAEGNLESIEELMENDENKKVAIPTYSRLCIFESKSTPKYHFKYDCAFLRADYKNYVIPKQIREKGAETIKNFVDFCKPRRKLVEEKDNYFIEEINKLFKVKINSFEELSLPNSGATDISSMDAIGLEIFIYMAIDSCFKILKNNYQSDKLINFVRYKELKKSDINLYSENFINEYIKNKLNLIEGLIQFYFKQQKESIEATTYILERSGFEKCMSCCT